MPESDEERTAMQCKTFGVKKEEGGRKHKTCRLHRHNYIRFTIKKRELIICIALSIHITITHCTL